MKSVNTAALRKSIAIFLVVLAPSVIWANEFPPTEVVISARQGVSTFLGQISAPNLDRFGFYSQADISGAEVGEAFQVFTIPPDKIGDYDPGLSDLSSVIVPTNLWQFLIVNQGRPKSLLTVDFFENQWTAVSIGASGLAAQLCKITETWPARAGYQWKLIKVYQAKSDLLEISFGHKVIGIVPLVSARVAMGFEEKDFDSLDLQDPKNIVIGLKPIVEKSLQEGK